MWQVRVYMDTGFNSINVPDSEATLAAAAISYKDFPTIDCLQKYFLNSIIIRGKEKDIIQGDYLKLYDPGPQGHDDKNFAYYVITGYTMTSGDTIQLSVVMDPLLTCGGSSNIVFMDGMTTRRSVHLSFDNDDDAEDDPLLIPRNVDLVCIGEYMGDATTEYQPGEGGSVIIRPGASCDLIVSSNYPIMQSDHVQIESSVDVEITEDSWTGTIASVPIIKQEYQSQDATKIDNNYGSSTSDMFYTVDGNVYYRFDSTASPATKQTALNRLITNCRDLISYGRSDVLSSAYFVPHKLCVEGESIETHNEPGPAPAVAVLDRIHIVKGMPIKDFKETFDNDTYFTLATDKKTLGKARLIDYYTEEFDYVPQYARSIMGSNTGFLFIVRDTGDNAELKATELSYDDYNPQGDYATAFLIPRVSVTVDLRPTGHIEYSIPNETVNSGKDWFHPAPVTLKSGNWEQASLTISAAENLYLNAQKFDLSSRTAEDKMQREMEFKLGEKTFGHLNRINPLAYLSQWYEGKIQDKAMSGYGADKLGRDLPVQYQQLVQAQASMGQGNPYAEAMYARANERIQERQEFIQSNYAQAHVICKGSGNTLTSGHGLLLFRRVPSVDDIKRFDRILNQFGSKVTEATDRSHIQGGRFYNYIEASGVSIRLEKNSAIQVPKSVREDLATLFSGGLRIWHTDPKNHTYTEAN